MGWSAIDFTGYSGYSGASGISGFSGESGISGFSGYSGISGFSGISGHSGISGFSGISGWSGDSGISGFSGASGISGFSGASGISGFSGISGHSGISGFSGISGIDGYSGFSGISGISGFSGSTANFTGRKIISNTQASNFYNGVSGTGNRNVSAIMSGETPVSTLTDDTTEGVPVDPPKNYIDLRNHDDHNPIVDQYGNEYDGRLTESGGVWTLTYYVWIAGAETAQNLQTTQDIEFMFPKRFNLDTIPEDFARPLNFSDEPGLQGYSGISGFSGYSGISGFSGISGHSGISGFSGISGWSGDSGISGWSGDSGISGFSGISGHSGISGFSGISGHSGISGWSGDSGISGWSGESGISGISGFSGAKAQQAQNVGIEITQASHGFTSGNRGNVVRHNGTIFVLAQANTEENAEAIGLIGDIVDAGHFMLMVSGLMDGLSTLSPGGVYYLSPTVPGALTITEPFANPQVSKPCLIAISSATGVIMTSMRGEIVPA